ncbi:MAG: SPFH domain-containing protein [Oscillospiraceae bacterium]|nr:SPFH domain-containing protein [Oscillospiraceae bacterium]
MLNKELSSKKVEEKILKAPNGLAMLFLSIILYIVLSFGGIICGGLMLDSEESSTLGVILLVFGILYMCVGWIPFLGIKIIRPNEALVLTLFGKYIGTLKDEGIFMVNPFCSAVNPAAETLSLQVTPAETNTQAQVKTAPAFSKKISLKAMTLDNKIQKINDRDGNPVEIRMIVIWRIVNTAKAVFNVDNYYEFISIQADSTLRDVASLYPYDSNGEDTKSLRGSSADIAEHLKKELSGRVAEAGIEIIEARITRLAYAPEIAAAMLQRQQAAAIIDARQKIVDGAVGMVEMALDRITANNVCDLDDERKAQMVSNLLVVLCGNKDAQPIVNSGSIY